MNKLQIIAAIAATLPAIALAETDQDRLEELDQKVRVLERKLEVQEEEAAKKAADAPVVKASDKGFTLESKDSAFQLRLRGLLQADGRFFVDDNDDPVFAATSNDTFLIRRARPIFEGSVGKLIGFRLQPEFAGDSATITDAYLDLKFSPHATVRAGKFKAPVGLERYAYSDSVLPFAEAAFPSELAPNRDIGAQLQGELFNGTINYAAGVFNGAVDGRDAITSDADDEHEVAERLFFTPFINQPDSILQGLGFGIGASAGKKEGAGNNFLPRYRTFGQQQIFAYRSAAPAPGPVSADGDHVRLAPQLYYYRNAFGLMSEYVRSKQEVLRGAVEEEFEHDAWQVTASYVLTGEDSTPKGVARPKREFDWDAGNWGAFEVAARYTELDIDDDVFAGGAASFADPNTQVSEAKAWGLGANWYLTNNLKTTIDYVKTSFEGGAAAGADRPDEKAIITRLQLQF